MFKYKNNKELKVEDLPHNRFELFFDLLKNRYKFIILNNLLLFLFSLPLFIGILFTVYEKKSYLGLDSTLISFDGLLFYNLIIFLVILVGSLILSIALSGLIPIVQTIVFREGIVYSEDFIRGIKENYLKVVTSAFLIDLSIFSLISSIDYLTFNQDIIGVLFLVISIFFLFFACIFSLFFISLNLEYKITIKDSIKNSIILFFGFFPRNILYFITTVIPVVICSYFGFISSIIYMLVISFLGYIPLVMASLMFTNYIFDLSINRNFKENYRRGLVDKND